nr:hypothetical protein [Tanacetum cinerariifolium]
MTDKHDVCVPKSVAKPHRKPVASESIKKPRNKVRKLNEHFGKIYKWTYIKFTPSGYMWKPKSKQANVNQNVSMPLGNASRTANVKDTMTSRRSTVSNTPLSSTSFAAHRDCKPTTFSNSFIRTDFSKSTSVTKNNLSNDFSKPVTAQTLPATKKPSLKNTNVLTPRMYKIRTAPTQATTSKLPQDSKKTNKSVSFSTGVIPTTNVSRPQLKSNPKGDRVLRSNSGGKKLEVEEPRRNVKLLKNKIFVTACTDSLNVKTVNATSVSAMCTKSVMIKKHDLRVPKSVAKPLRKPVASESIKKPRNNVRKLNERFGKIYKWTYIKFTPSGYMWKPKSKQANVNQNVGMPLGNASRTANVKDTMTFRRYTVSNTPLSSNSFAAHRDCPIHRRLW